MDNKYKMIYDDILCMYLNMYSMYLIFKNKIECNYFVIKNNDKMMTA